MIEPLEGLPSGVIGFEAIGEVEAAQFTGLLVRIIGGTRQRDPIRIAFLRGAERDADVAWGAA